MLSCISTAIQRLQRKWMISSVITVTGMTSSFGTNGAGSGNAQIIAAAPTVEAPRPHVPLNPTFKKNHPSARLAPSSFPIICPESLITVVVSSNEAALTATTGVSSRESAPGTAPGSKPPSVSGQDVGRQSPRNWENMLHPIEEARAPRQGRWSSSPRKDC